MTLEPLGSKSLWKPQVSGFVPLGALQPGPLALGRSAFLLDPGGQDYVGYNSYDGTIRADDEEPCDEDPC
jgi:hypothetical protein